MPLTATGDGLFVIRAGNLTIGWSALEHHDSGMGVAFGVFHPSPDYPSVQPVFRLFVEATSGSGDPAISPDLQRYNEARGRLGLTVLAPDGALIRASSVHVYDYTVEAGADALEAEVIVADRAAWEDLAGPE